MWPYLLMFMLPAWMAAQEPSPRLITNAMARIKHRIPAAWWWIMLGLSLLVGWRHQVGGDWVTYLENFQLYAPTSLETV